MSYTPTVWQNGDVITAEKLNHIENGIASQGTKEFLISHGAELPSDVPVLPSGFEWEANRNYVGLYNIAEDRAASLEELLSLDANSIIAYFSLESEEYYQYVVPCCKTVEISYDPDNVQENQSITVTFECHYYNWDDEKVDAMGIGYMLTVSQGIS